MSMFAMSKDVPHKAEVTVFSHTERPKQSADKSALASLSKFIPTEIIAPYAAALSLAPQQQWSASVVYWTFVAVCPLLLIVFSLAQRAGTGKPWPALVPLLWRAIAATIAFAVWGIVVPSNPLQHHIGGAGIAGFMAIAIAPILDAIDKIVFRLLGVKNGQF